MATASVYSVNTADAGSVDIAFPAGAAASVGGFVVNTSLAGSVRSTGTTTGSGANNAAATGGCVVTTTGAGSVDVVGRARKVNTCHAGSVKVDCTATEVAVAVATPATGAGDGDPAQEGAKISWKVGAAAAAAATAVLELFDLAHGDKIRVLLVVIVGAAEVHARGGAMGRRIVYASLAMLLVAVAAWIRSPSGRILEP